MSSYAAKRYNVESSRRHRLAAAKLRAFEASIASPFDLGTEVVDVALPNAFVMPEEGRLAVALDAELTADSDLIVTVNGDVFGTQAAAADTIQKLSLYRKAASVTVTSAVAGDVSLYVIGHYGVPKLIATGTVTAS